MLKASLSSLYYRFFSSNTRIERIWKIAQVDFKRRYYNDRLGLIWALANPLTQIALYYFVFTRIFQRKEEHFVLFLFAGLIFWLSFAQSTTFGLKVLTNKIHLLESVRFNWIDLYTSHMISMSFGLIFNLAAYLVLLILTGASLGGYLYLLPVVLLTWYLLTAGASIILGLIRPVFEDISHIWSLLLMIGLWVTGIFFPGTFYFENYQWFIWLNPLVGLILNVRACLLEGNDLHVNLLLYDFAFGLILYLLALYLFRRYAKKVTEQL
jgi:ABC-type polysaccharide/polyol phosphate export systems, permease component